MDAFLNMFVALALPGFIFVKRGLLKQEQSGILSKHMMYVGMPGLILSSTINKITFSTGMMASMLIIALVGIVYTLVMFFASTPLTSMEKNTKTRGMMRFCAVFANNGFLGIPLANAVFGEDSPVLPVVIILNIITNVLMQTLGVYLVSGDKKQMSFKKALLNPLVIAFFVGVILNLLKVKDYVPEIPSFVNYFSGIVTPISMTILGMKMASVKLTSLFTSWKTYYVSALRLVIFPAVILAVLIAMKNLFGFELITNDIILGSFVAFAMPTAGLASTFADSLDGDTQNAVAFTLGTTIISIITIPVLYFIINLLLEASVNVPPVA